MIELKSDRLIVSFPELPLQPVLKLDFQRTLRIPDDGRDYPLPPGLGSFPLRHTDDHARRAPASWLERGGVLLPMWQSEAMWLSFRSDYIDERRTAYPIAVKVATGKVNAITGESWQRGLSRNPQDYLVTPKQPWLDGYCVEKEIIRQFVAMPLGGGYSAEEQLTGEAEFGGLQLEFFAMRPDVFEKRFPIRPPTRLEARDLCEPQVYFSLRDMGVAPGGRMRQEIYADPFSIHDWDTEHGSRCFVHLVNSTTWQAITGQAPPSQPRSARDYTRAGLPWFDYYDADQKALSGSKVLASLKSVREKGEERCADPLPGNESVAVTNIVGLRSRLQPDQVRESDFS